MFFFFYPATRCLLLHWKARFRSLCCQCCCYCAYIRQLEKSLCNERSLSYSLFHTNVRLTDWLHTNGENVQFFPTTLDLICMRVRLCVFIKLMKIVRHYFKLHTNTYTCFYMHMCSCKNAALEKLCNAAKLSQKRMKNRYESETLTNTH